MTIELLSLAQRSPAVKRGGAVAPRTWLARAAAADAAAAAAAPPPFVAVELRQWVVVGAVHGRGGRGAPPFPAPAASARRRRRTPHALLVVSGGRPSTASR